MSNIDPFRPNFGASPPRLAGRDPQLGDIENALDNDPGASGRFSLFTGIRGTGKTALLNAAGDLTFERGWILVEAIADDDFVGDLTNRHLPAVARQLDQVHPAPIRRVTDISVQALGVGFSIGSDMVEQSKVATALDGSMAEALDACERAGVGLMITLDEVHRADPTLMGKFATATEGCVRQNRQLAVVMAGLPHAVSTVLNPKASTFLQRVEEHRLGPLTDDETREALAAPLEQAGWSITPQALDVAANGTGNYPIMIQVVGSQLCRVARNSDTIELSDANLAVEQARLRGDRVAFDPVFKELPAIDKPFIQAMAVDDGSSRLSDIAGRLNIDDEQAESLCRRLDEAGLVNTLEPDRVDFKFAHMRNFLRNNPVTKSATSRDALDPRPSIASTNAVAQRPQLRLPSGEASR